MKKIILCILSVIVLASCNGWGVHPLPQPTPFLPPTRTPSIYSPTPVDHRRGILHARSRTADGHADLPPDQHQPASAHIDRVPVNTFTPTPFTNAPALRIVILGCNTSIDIIHGMGEVTNAFVTLKNVGNVELTNLIATLFARDEGREHPDKTLEVVSIPVGYEVTIKITVDSTYRAETPSRWR